MIKRITNNFGWKLLSIVLAFLTWLLIVQYEDPMITETFNNIIVEKYNVDVITSEKKSIEYKEGETVSVVVRGKRSIVDEMTKSDVIAIADLQKKSITGAVDIEIKVPESVTVMDKSPTMMMVELENIITVQKEIQYYMEGEPEEGYIYLDPIITPNNVEIEGPESKIGIIKSVLVPVNIDGVTKDVTLFSSLQISDDSNNAITGLVQSINQVEIQVPIQKLKTVPIYESLGDKVAEGYELVGITLNQKELSVRGETDVIDNLSSLTVSGIDISGYTESITLDINVASILPSQIYVYNDVSVIQVTLEIEPIVEKTLEVTHNDITVRNIPDGMQFSYTDDLSYQITFRGISSKLEDVDLNRISPSITLIGLEEGIYRLELSFYEPFGVDLVSEPPFIEIELLLAEEIIEGDEELTDPDETEGTDGTNNGTSDETNPSN